jgi:lysophospholipase L1-like esterase
MRIIFQGDSLTVDGIGGDKKYTSICLDELGILDKWHIGIYGENGMTISSMRRRGKMVDDGYREGDIFVLNGGINDIRLNRLTGHGHTGDVELYRDIVDICTSRRRRGFKVVVLSISKWDCGSMEEASRSWVNGMLREYGRDFADYFFDIEDLLRGEGDWENYLEDRVHWNEHGHEVVGRGLGRVIGALL